MTSPLEKRLRRIVEGQVRSYRNDHPEKFSKDALVPRHWRTVEMSLSKRIVPDIMRLLLSGGRIQDDGAA